MTHLLGVGHPLVLLVLAGVLLELLLAHVRLGLLALPLALELGAHELPPLLGLGPHRLALVPLAAGARALIDRCSGSECHGRTIRRRAWAFDGVASPALRSPTDGEYPMRARVRASARRQERLPAFEIGDVAASFGKRGNGGGVVQTFLDDLRLFGRPDPPAVAEDEVAADPGADEDRRLCRREEPEPPTAGGDGRGQRDERRGVDEAVDRGRPPDRMIRWHRQPVDPPDEAGRQRGSGGAGRDDVAEPDPLGRAAPIPQFGGDGQRDQDDRTIGQDRVDRMTVNDRMLRKVHRVSSYPLTARSPSCARGPETEA